MPAVDARKRLEDLLLSLFTPDELRRVLRGLPAGEQVSNRLPSTNASPTLLSRAAVEALEEAREVTGEELWSQLRRERSRRGADIATVQALYIPPPPPVEPAAEALELLLVSSGPEDLLRQRAEQEFARVTARLAARGRVQVHQLHAPTFDSLCAALVERSPHVLHISGQSDRSGRILLDCPVPGFALHRLLRALGDRLRLCILNASYSLELARALPPAVDWAIGMTDALHDDDAVNFSATLYELLAAGKSVQVALDVALARLTLHASSEPDPAVLPQLFPADSTQRRGLLAPAR